MQRIYADEKENARIKRKRYVFKKRKLAEKKRTFCHVSGQAVDGEKPVLAEKCMAKMQMKLIKANGEE